MYVASGIGGFDIIEREHIKLMQGGPGKISPFFHSFGDCESRFRPYFDSLRSARAELRYGHGLLGFCSRDRRLFQNY